MFVNRLKEYMDKTPITWRALGAQIDMSTPTISKIRNIDSEEGLRWMSLGSYKVLRDKLGVDMLDCIK